MGCDIFDNILIVCVGNVCRSPTAERILKSKLTGKAVSSAGLGALKGRGIDDCAAALLLEHGYSAENHSARQVSNSMLVEADVVLVMEKSHQRALMKNYPFLSGKVMLLGHWQNIEIDDPYRKSREAFSFVFKQISKSCDDWAYRIDRS